MSKVTIGDRMKGLRLNSGKSFRWLGKNVFSRTAPAICRLEEEDTIPTHMLKAACEYYEVSADWILFGKESSNDEAIRNELTELRGKLAAIQRILD